MNEYWRALRPHQWVKGVFIVLPLIFGGQLFNPRAVIETLAMVVLFSLASSGVYLINDIFDLAEDRIHPEKKNRPLASGSISPQQAGWLAALLLILSLGGSFVLKWEAGFIIAFYLVLNYFYSRYFKKVVIVDVFCVGAFYYLRVFAGGVISRVMLSHWIVMCTVLLALFLGFNKRKYDLAYNAGGGAASPYDHSFLDRMISIIASALVMSYALYVMDPQTMAKFGTRALIYTVPFVFYGIFRYIYLMDKRILGGDPARILLKDGPLKWAVFLWLLACAVVIYR